MSESRLRETARPQFVAREVGPATIGLLVVANAVLWIVGRPAGQPTGTFVGQLLGALAKDAFKVNARPLSGSEDRDQHVAPGRGHVRG